MHAAVLPSGTLPKHFKDFTVSVMQACVNNSEPNFMILMSQ